MSRAVGIDLGTTNSVVAVFEAGEPTSSGTRKARARRLYREAAAQYQGGPQSGADADDNEVVDAEVVEGGAA